MTRQSSSAEIQFRLHPSTRRRAHAGNPESVGPVNGRLPRVTQVMALAINFQDMIQRGEAKDYADVARLGGLTRERISQVMELIWLAPDIQQEILEFPPSFARFLISEVAARKIAGELLWDTQRLAWAGLKQMLNC
jgi:hypothetical protein